LSITTHPTAAARGAYSLAAPHPTANSAMSQPAKSKCSMFRHVQNLAGVAIFDLGPGGATGGYRSDLVHRKLAFGEDLHHFTPDIAGRPDDGHPIAQFAFSFCVAVSEIATRAAATTMSCAPQVIPPG